VPHSNTFSSWGITSMLSPTTGHTGYDGTSNAWKIIPNTSNTSHRVWYPSLGLGYGVYTISIYAKAAGYSTMYVYQNSTGADYASWFDLSAGTIGSGVGRIDTTITDVGSGWYRCTLTGIEDLSSIEIYVGNSTESISFAGDGTSGILLQDAQLEQGLVARDYQETTTAAVYGGITDNTPRLDYTDSSCPALLLEPQRTNLINHSEYGAGASLSNMTATSNAATSPEGVSNATTMQTGITGQCQVYQSFTASTGNHTGSVFLKKVDFDWVYMEVGGAVGWFNIGSGTLGNGSAYGSNWTYVSHDIQDYGNGWYRCTLTGNCVNAGGYTFRSLQPVSNNGGYFSNLAGGDTHWYGTQVEAGSYETSYIPTYGSSVTRNAENTKATNVSDLIGQSEGTLYVETKGQTKDSSLLLRVAQSGGVYGDSIYIDIAVGGSLRAVIFNNYVSQMLSTTSVTDGQSIKAALAYSNNDCVFYLNGTQIASDISVSLPTSLADILLGSYYPANSAQQYKGTNQALVFKTRLSNEELADLTTI
jgi:hypothetical protein